MEILCACDELYLPHAATMLCSLLEHNGVSRIHLLHSSIEKRELSKLESMAARYGSKIAFYEIVPGDFGDLEYLRVDKWYSTAIYYRLLAPQLLPAELDKILYLDSDIIVRRSLADFWNTDITGQALAAVSNYEDDARKALGLADGTPYFNSGVLLINLEFWRQNNVPKHAISFVRNNPERVQFPDQDALNATLIGKWIELPAIWNWQIWWSSPGSAPAIVHFITKDKPWHWFNTHPFKNEYHQYRRKTPWRQYFPRTIDRPLRSITRVILPSRLRAWLQARITPKF